MPKRIREVYPSDMVAHLWAHQSQPHARNGRNFSFDGPKLVSYSTTIGRIVQDKAGTKVALLSHYTYSVTTSQQIYSAEHACRGVMPVYRVDHGIQWYPEDDAAKQRDHTANVRDYLSRYADGMGKALRGSPDNSDWRMRNARSTLDIAREYAERFGVEGIEWPDHTAMVAAVCARNAKLAIGAWRQGVAVRVPRGDSAMLRLRGDAIETSWGASFPASHGIIANTCSPMMAM